MLHQLKIAGGILYSLVILSACQKDTNQLLPASIPEYGISVSERSNNLNSNQVRLNFSGLEDLGPNARYEGWVIINGVPVTTGIFSVDANGNQSQEVFTVLPHQGRLRDANMFVLTIEPYPDNSPMPSNQHILAGAFNGTSAALSTNHPAALNTNFSTATGTYLLATPTTASTTDELSGIWYINNRSGSPMAGLYLPVLPDGWIYEGWVVIDGQPVSTGTFMGGMMADNSSIFSGPMPEPPFPGEDFIYNAPSGLMFPALLPGKTAVISVEPYPDNSTAPFSIKPLVGQIPMQAMQHYAYDLNLNMGSLPAGVAVKKHD